MIYLDEAGNHAVTPIGFSRDGKFAYIEWRFYNELYYSDMSEYQIDVHLVIIDLVTDKELIRRYLDGSGRDENTMTDLLNESTAEFQQELSAHNIIAEYPNEYYHRFPYKGHSLNHMADDGYIDGTCIEVQSSTGKKVVADFSADDYSFIQCKGLLKSPFEERVVILLIVTCNGYETGLTTFIKIVGCNLKAGFK
ncbi:MAG: hypothetical protein JW822_07900 [Spirochaetales bacterium]|nr:hypothetical protein [Spirochaetales bacterium]